MRSVQEELTGIIKAYAWQIIERCLKWFIVIMVLTPLLLALLRNSLGLN